jgi:hypothetical protein
MKRAANSAPLMWIVAFLFLANIYDPGGTFGIKYASAVVGVATIIVTMRWFELARTELMVGIGLFAVWPAWSLVYGLLNRADAVVAVGQVIPFLFAPILAGLIQTGDGDLRVRLFYRCMFSLAVVVVLLFAACWVAPESGVVVAIVDFLSKHGEKQGFFGDTPDGMTIYFGSTLFLVPTFIYFIFTERIWRSLVVLLALALSFSKSGVVICLAFAALFLFIGPGSRVGAASRSSAVSVFGRTRKVLPFITMGLMAVVLFLSFRGLGEEVWAAATVESETSLLRQRHIESVMVLFQEHPDYLLTGQGAGTTFFSTGYNGKLYAMEVDHLDTIRKFGLPWFIAFSLLILRTALKLVRTGERNKRAAGFALFGGYVAWGTNPVFVTPLSIMLVITCYFAQRQDRRSAP